MIEKIFDKTDELIMNGFQKTVNSWNWVTGGDKFDLEKVMRFSVAIPVISGLIYAINNSGRTDVPSIIGTHLLGYIAGFSLSRIPEYANELKILESSESDLKMIETNEVKTNCKRLGYINQMGGSIMMSYAYNQTYNTQDTVFYSANALLGAGSMVLACDNPKKRKNCVTRGFDLVSDKIAEYKSQPDSLPVPQPI